MLKQLLITGMIATSVITAPLFASEEALAQDLNEEPPLPVKTITVPPLADLQERTFFGRVAARDTVALAFEVGGQIAVLDAQEGAFVPKGTLLSALDLGHFKRRIERAELAVEQSTRALRRATSLAEKNVASQVRAEDAQTAFDLAEVELRDARAALEDAQIFAPFDAQIADRIASQHSITEPGQTIVRLHDLSELRVQFDLPERLLHEMGDISDVTFVGSVSGQDKEFRLSFREFRAETGEIGQTYTISLAIDPEAAARLRPGQTMQVRGAIAKQNAAPTIPSTAIATASDGTQHVVKIEESDAGLRAAHLPITVQSPTGSALSVTGLQTGVEIVEVGAHAVEDGALVKRYVGLSRVGG